MERAEHYTAMPGGSPSVESKPSSFAVLGLRIYLARPISGCSGEDVFAYYRQLQRELSDLYVVLCPMTGKAHLRTSKCYAPTGYEHPVSSDHAIASRDHWMVSQADVVYANLVGATEKSIGVVAELAWAYHLGKHVVVAMEAGNVHEHAFVMEMASIRYHDHESALAYLVELGSGNL